MDIKEHTLRIDKVKGMVSIELYIEVSSIKNSISSILYVMTCTRIKTTNRVGKSVSQGSAHVFKFRLPQEQVVIFDRVGKDFPGKSSSSIWAYF